MALGQCLSCQGEGEDAPVEWGLCAGEGNAVLTHHRGNGLSTPVDPSRKGHRRPLRVSEEKQLGSQAVTAQFSDNGWTINKGSDLAEEWRKQLHPCQGHHRGGEQMQLWHMGNGFVHANGGTKIENKCSGGTALV